jgi:hypothetical protein
MTLRSFLLVSFGALAVSCSSFPVVGSLSPQAAQREAHRDIQSGHMKLYLAGTIGVHTVGVEAADLALVKKLPRLDTLPSGCTNPQAGAGIDYARAYNREIVRYLRSHPVT